MRTPKFWEHNGLMAHILKPISWLYGYVTQWRIHHKKPYHCGAKVICIGNITAGGVGKTPVAIAMAERYINEGKKVFFVTRGYKGKLKNIIVDLDKHTPSETGDEARILALTAPTVIATDRAHGAKLAIKNGADMIIMDDGFQNQTLYKDESWLVFDGTVGVGNGQIIPSGPLREELKTGQSRADYIIIMGEDKTDLAKKCTLPVFYGRLEPQALDLDNKNVMAFAGIGHPAKFYQTLSDMGYNVVKSFDFADHYAYKKSDIAKLVNMAKAQSLELVTTEKDFVKLDKEDQKRIHVLKVKANWQKNNPI